MDIKKDFGNKLRKIRIRQGYTQESLAEKINLSAKSLSQIELGNNFVSAETLTKLCEVFELPPKTLFDFDDKNKITQNISENTIKKIKSNKKLLNLINYIIELFEI